MTQFLLKMGAIFKIIFLILCAVLSQEIVHASDDSLAESSSDPHIRQKRMDPSPPAQPGSSPSHQLPPLLAYNLRAVNVIAPTVVVITRNGNFIGVGYAIHPYFVLTISVFARIQYVTGVSTISRHGEGHIPQRIQNCKTDPTGEFVLIQIKDPIFLDDPVHGALHAAKYPVSASNWASHQLMEWIPRQLLFLRPLLRQNLTDSHFINPVRVQITSSDRPAPGSGYAVHAYIVITRPEFMGRNASVVTFKPPIGEPNPHRIQFRYPNRALNVEVLELLDPVFISNGVAGSLTAEHYSAPAIAWARNRVEEWKRTRLSQPNFYQQNAV